MSTASEHNSSNKGILSSVFEGLGTRRQQTKLFGETRPVFEVKSTDEETLINPRNRIGLNRREEVVLNAILAAEPESEERVMLTSVYQKLRAYRARPVPMELQGVNVGLRSGIMAHFEDVLSRNPNFSSSQSGINLLVNQSGSNE